MHLEAGGDCSIEKLIFRLINVLKHAKYRFMAISIKFAAKIEDHRLGPIHAATADDVQYLHKLLSTG